MRKNKYKMMKGNQKEMKSTVKTKNNKNPSSNNNKRMKWPSNHVLLH